MSAVDIVAALPLSDRGAWLREHPTEMWELRRHYLQLPDQERADFLFRLRIGGASLRLAPHQYPKAEPRHRRCTCDGEAEIRIGINDCFVRCARCGRETNHSTMPWIAWEAWDDGGSSGEIRLW